MNDLQTDADKCYRVGIEEKFIKFKSSPNFINMKKFLKSKFDLPVQTSPNHDMEDSPSPSMTANNHTIQPPLPLDPPPADSPDKSDYRDNEELQTETTIKQESTEESETEESVSSVSTELVQSAPAPKSVACRDFIRGTCTRPDCRYLHEYDASLLHRLYTFCRNYQNSACTLPNCRYAHASVFEEQAFYRTGILPPHALAHHKNNVANSNVVAPNAVDKNFMLQPPPPPPPPPVANAPSEELPQTMIPLNIANAQPPLRMGVENLKTIPMMNCMPPVLVPTNPSPIKDAVCGNTSPNLKRSWPEHEEFTVSPRGQEAIAKRQNKCENCILLENRLQYTKVIVEGMTKSSVEFTEKMNELEKKNNRLLTCILSVVKPLASQAIMPSHNGLGSIYQTLNLTDGLPLYSDQDKVSLMTDQLKQLVQVRMAKMNSEDKSMKAFPMSAGNNVQSNQPSVNVANLNSSRQLTNLFNSWGGHHP